jgi:hypothetical protein
LEQDKQKVAGSYRKCYKKTECHTHRAWPREIKQMKAIVRQQKLITITEVCQQTKIHLSFGRDNNTPFGNCISANLNIYLLHSTRLYLLGCEKNTGHAKRTSFCKLKWARKEVILRMCIPLGNSYDSR